MSDASIQAAVQKVRSYGFAVLRGHLPAALVDQCREGVWPHWETFLRENPAPNHGASRYFFAMPFEEPCFSPQFFIDPEILRATRSSPAARSVAEGDASRPPEPPGGNNGSFVGDATPTRLLRFPAVRERTGLSRSTIWRLERRGEFPRHRRISANAVAWVEEEVADWIRAKSARDA